MPMATLSKKRRSRAFLAVMITIPGLYFLIYFSVLIVNNLTKGMFAAEIAHEEAEADQMAGEAAIALDQHDTDLALARYGEVIERYRQISRRLGRHFDRTIDGAMAPKGAGTLSNLDEIDFERMWRVESKLGDALLKRGHLFLQKNDFSNALADFNIAIRRNSKNWFASENPVAYEGRARANRALGRNAQADTDENTAKTLRDMQAHKSEKSK